MPASSFQLMNPVVDVASFAAITTSTLGSKMILPLAEVYTVVFDVTITSGTSPTVDMIMKTSYDKGTTYIYCPLRSAHVSATAVHWNTFKCGHGDGEAALSGGAALATTGGALNSNFHFDPNYVKFYATVAGSTPVLTVKVYVFAHPMGTRGAGAL